jgi:hypothetical protein
LWLAWRCVALYRLCMPPEPVTFTQFVRALTGGNPDAAPRWDELPESLRSLWLHGPDGERWPGTETVRWVARWLEWREMKPRV